MSSRSVGISRNQWALGIAGALVALGTASAQAQTTYNVVGLADFTGPYADIMGDFGGCRRGVVDWWNEEVGKGLGIALKMKDYDTRYDVAQTASLWPGILSELHPILAFAVGGADTAALQERLPSDKVPLFIASGSYGYTWKPNLWVFNARPTYAHETTAFLEWYRKKRGGEGPVKIGIISSEASPAYIDIARGMEKYAKDNPKNLEVVETIFTAIQPTDLTLQVKRLVTKGVEVITINTNTAAVVAVRRALQSVGKPNIPVVLSSHNSLPASGKAIGDLKLLEGSYEAYAMAIPTDEQTSARVFFDKLKAKYKVNASYSAPCMMGLNQALVGVRAIENAAKATGASKIDGPAVRAALLSAPISTEQTFGVLSNLKFSQEAPFPQTGLSINIGTIQNGQYKILAKDVPIPHLNKW